MWIKAILLGFGLAGVLTTASTAVSAAPPAYHAIVLGLADGRTTLQVAGAVALNRWGQVLGVYGAPQSNGTHAVLWTPAVANDGSGAGATLFPIETSPGMPPGTADTYPSGLNDRGQVVGTAATPGAGANNTQSWMWRPKTLNSLMGVLHGGVGATTVFPSLIGPFGVLSPQVSQSINNKGVIAAGGVNGEPALFTPTVPNGVTGSWSAETANGGTPAALNDSGQFVGGTCAGAPWNGPYLHQGPLPMASGDNLTSPQWISPNGPTCVGGALAINAAGHVLIEAASSSQNTVDSYLYKSGVVTDLLPGGGGGAAGINSFDQIVGYTDRAVLLENGEVLDLNVLSDVSNGLFLRSAIRINDAGQILANGQYPGAGGPVLLTPIALVTNPVKVATSPPNIAGTTYSVAVTVTNLGTTTITGPISLALDNLTNGVSLSNAVGATFYTRPGSPYVDISGGDLVAGATTSTFTLVFANPKGKTIKFNGRVLGTMAPR